jgi:hypothetical protein
LQHHQAKNNKKNKVSRGEESSSGDMEQHEHGAGQQRITSLTTNKKVAVSNRRPSGPSIIGASTAPGSSSDPTGRSEQAQASSRGETRNKVSIGTVQPITIGIYLASSISLFLKNAGNTSRVLLRFAI